MMETLKNIKLMVLYFSIFIIATCTPNVLTTGPENTTDIVGLNKQVTQHEAQIKQIEQKLISYQEIIDNYSSVNDEISYLKHEFKITLDKLSTDTLEQDYLDILNQLQKKINILEDRTLFTDSLYFEIVNEMVFVDNKISSLILSFKEINDLSVNKSTKAIPEITDDEYKDKYIESLSHYQNSDWNLSLNGFNYLIQVNNNHNLAANCQYWIGEIYYALNDYNRSIKEFNKVSLFPGTNKSDDSQFKIGLCYMKIGQIDRARQEFQKLQDLFPNSEYFQRAQGYLQ